MAHTRPDYTTSSKMATIYGEVDNGELAARLGSINTYDRRGNIVFMEDFEGALFNWQINNNGAGAGSVLAAAYSRTGSQAAQLTAGSGLNGYTTIWKYWPLPVSTQIGLECSFTTHASLDRFVAEISIYDGVTLHATTCGCSVSADEIYFNTGPVGVESCITNLGLYNSDYNFHTMKFAFDYSTDYWMRILFDNYSYDASAWPIHTELSAITPRMYIGLWAVCEIVANPVIYVDDVILTQNEPL